MVMRGTIPGLILETEEDRRRTVEADARRAEGLKAREALKERLSRIDCFLLATMARRPRGLDQAATLRRRRASAAANAPLPSSRMLAGSGTEFRMPDSLPPPLNPCT